MMFFSPPRKENDYESVRDRPDNRHYYRYSTVENDPILTEFTTIIGKGGK
jgi:hypothetical protein